MVATQTKPRAAKSSRLGERHCEMFGAFVTTANDTELNEDTGLKAEEISTRLVFLSAARVVDLYASLHDRPLVAYNGAPKQPGAIGPRTSS